MRSWATIHVITCQVISLYFSVEWSKRRLWLHGCNYVNQSEKDLKPQFDWMTILALKNAAHAHPGSDLANRCPVSYNCIASFPGFLSFLSTKLRAWERGCTVGPSRVKEKRFVPMACHHYGDKSFLNQSDIGAEWHTSSEKEWGLMTISLK